MDLVSRFWNSAPPTLASMFLLPGSTDADRLERPEILSLLPPFAKGAVLDLAAGIGRYSGEFAKTASRVVSVDLSASFIEESRLRNRAYPHIEYLTANVMDLAFPPASFDLVFANSLFMYLEDEQVTVLLARVAKWLKPNGFFFARDSCAAVRSTESPLEGYFVIYRSLYEVPRFFSPPWRLYKEGNLKTFEDLYADPFKCYWVYKII